MRNQTKLADARESERWREWEGEATAVRLAVTLFVSKSRRRKRQWQRGWQQHYLSLER